MRRNFDIQNTEALFFDFDGVIADTIDIKTEAFRDIFKAYGVKAAEKMVDYHRKNGGISRYEKFKYFYNHFLGSEITKEKMRSLDRKLSRIVFDKVIKAPFIKGAKKFIILCNKSYKKCFIISATPTREIKRIVKAKNLKRYFSEVLGSPKSKADNLKNLLRKYKLTPGRCFYFGDARNDREAAVACRVNFVGINCADGVRGYADFEEFIKRGISDGVK